MIDLLNRVMKANPDNQEDNHAKDYSPSIKVKAEIKVAKIHKLRLADLMSKIKAVLTL